MCSEKHVETDIVSRSLITAIPPEPIAAFRCVKRLPGTFQSFLFRWIISVDGGADRQGVTSLAEIIPRLVFLALANPGFQIIANPGTGVQIVNRFDRGMTIQIF